MSVLPHFLTPRHFPLILFLSASTILFPTSAEPTSPSQDDTACFQHDFYDCSKCPCDPNGSVHHTFIFIIHLISFIASLLFILTFSFIQGLRRNPGPIVIALTTANLIYSLEEIITSFKNLLNGSSGTYDNTLCLAFGYINFASLCLTYLYQISFFCFYTFVKHQQRASRWMNAEYHIVPIVFTVFVIVYLYSQDGFGRTIGGGCSVKSSESIVTPLVGFGVLIVILFGLLFLIRKIAAGENRTARSVVRAAGHYSKYLLLTCFIFLAICILRIATAVCVGMYSSDDQPSLLSSLETMLVFIGLFQVINPLLVVVSWMRDHKSHEPLQRYFGDYRWINWLWTLKSSYSLGDVTDEESETLDRDLLNEGSAEPEVVSSTESSRVHPVLVDSKEYRMNLVFTMLLSIRYYWHVQKERRGQIRDGERGAELDQQRHYKKEAKTKAYYHISASNMQKQIPQVLEKLLPQGQRILPGILTVYAMSLFAEIIGLDDMGKYIQLSLDINKNMRAVEKSGVNPQGKNTLFHFASADNKLIFRNITENELKALLTMLPYFVMHLKSNQNSLIAKIYGLFTYEVMNPYQKWHFIAIRNINKYPQHRLERAYELKGTPRFRRTVMDESIQKSELRHCGTLKDYDFNNFDKSIRVGADTQSKLLSVLKRDIHFLISQDLIDYNLSLFILNRGRLPSALSDVVEAQEELEASFVGDERLWRGESIASNQSHALDSSEVKKINPYTEIESSVEEVHYAIGIVDYLKKYNSRVKLNILLRKWGLDTSPQDLTSEDPVTYGRRIMDYLQKIIEE